MDCQKFVPPKTASVPGWSTEAILLLVGAVGSLLMTVFVLYLKTVIVAFSNLLVRL